MLESDRRERYRDREREAESHAATGYTGTDECCCSTAFFLPARYDVGIQHTAVLAGLLRTSVQQPTAVLQQ